MTDGLASTKRRVVTRLKDWAKFSPLTREGLAARGLLRYWLPAHRVDGLIQAYQRTAFGPLQRYAAAKLRTLLPDPARVTDAQLGARWARFMGGTELTRSIVLKAPGPDDEKGVLLLTAEYNWLKLLTTPSDFKDLESRFTLLFSAGWSPLDYGLIGLALRKTTGSVFVEPGNFSEVSRIEALHPRVRCLPTICSAWIHPDLFHPKPLADRKIDLLMVANWAPFKRHWDLFTALKQMPQNLRITLIGQPDGPFTVDRIRQQARDFGSKQDIQYVENLRVEQVYEAMCDSRALIILSRQEGPCVVVTESMFADTPVAMLRHAHIGSKAYINEQTGVLLDSGLMSRQLMSLLDLRDQFRPREWAIKNISCHTSLARWNAFLRDNAIAEGRPWTRELVPFCWKPFAVYLRPEDQASMKPVYEDLNRHHPALFGPQFLPESLPPIPLAHP